ncbi:PD-(D/E)XK motif protein [Psychrobacillus sp. NPDC093180]|uniref:PD-(D/E)XK motif protein n=1 Tax=Psychrobacillus sp. NPDC093180 TaxID=3364489 RepID=UPI00381940CD
MTISQQLPSCKGFEVKLTEVKDKFGNILPNLTIVGKQNKQNEFHLYVMNDFIMFADGISSNSEMAIRAIERLHEWSEYFDRCSDTLFKMDGNAQRGLYGELRFLEKLLMYAEHMAVIVAWRGPEKQSHDFKFPTVHYEVKTLTVDQADKVSINGMAQITPPKEKELFFYLIKMDVNENTGETLQDIIRRIEVTLEGDNEAIALFWKKLLKMNYPTTGIHNAIYFHELLIHERWYRIPSTLSDIEHDSCLRMKNIDFSSFLFEQSYPENTTNEKEAIRYLKKQKKIL